jgi:hypothetical protein
MPGVKQKHENVRSGRDIDPISEMRIAAGFGITGKKVRNENVARTKPSEMKARTSLN